MTSVLIQVNGDDLSLRNVPFSDGRPSWMDTIPFNIITDGVVVDGIIFGSATQNLPLTFPTTTSTGFLLTNYSDIFYNRIIFEPSLLNLGAVSSTQQRTIRVFNAFFNPATLQNIINNSLTGLTISGSVLPVIFNALQEIEYTITVGTEGPPNIAGNFTFDWIAPVDDFAFEVAGTRIILFPYIMSPGMTEELNFLTQVITTNNGTEQRIRNRKAPRQQFSFRTFSRIDELGRTDNLLYAGRGRLWALPVWSEARSITNSVVVDDQTISVDTRYGDFRAGSLAIIWENARKFDLFEILSFTDSEITLSRGVADDFDTAFVAPVRTTRLLSNPRRSTTGYDSVVDLSMEVLDNVELATSASPQQFNGLDVFLTEPSYSGIGADESYQEVVEVVDFLTGPFQLHRPWNNPKIDRPVEFILEGLQEIWEFREFFHRRGGRQLPFYSPSFETNFVIESTGTLSDQILIRNDEFVLLTPGRTNVAFLQTDNTWLFRTITGAISQPNNQELLTLDSPLNVDASLIAKMCYFSQKRLAGDRLEFRWQSNNVALVTVTFKEVAP